MEAEKSIIFRISMACIVGLVSHMQFVIQSLANI